jgi:hypothetical protein
VYRPSASINNSIVATIIAEAYKLTKIIIDIISTSCINNKVVAIRGVTYSLHNCVR